MKPRKETQPMNMADKVNKVISIPMLAISVVFAIADFQNGDFAWGVCMVLCGAWWMHVIYDLFISKKL